jgi:hypothetical protein
MNKIANLYFNCLASAVQEKTSRASEKMLSCRFLKIVLKNDTPQDELVNSLSFTLA